MMVDRLTCDALRKAVAAFYDCIKKDGLDGAYWDVEFTAFELDNEFNRWKRVTIEENFKWKGEDEKQNKMKHMEEEE